MARTNIINNKITKGEKRAFTTIKNKIKSLKSQINSNREGNRTVGSSVTHDNMVARINTMAKVNMSNPIVPQTCSGTSFQCDVTGSGKTPIKEVNMRANGYDYLATPMFDANLSGKTFRLPVLHNWKNSTNETCFTKDSLKSSYGFENFQ